jgi:hypothetical protein
MNNLCGDLILAVESHFDRDYVTGHIQGIVWEHIERPVDINVHDSIRRMIEQDISESI